MWRDTLRRMADTVLDPVAAAVRAELARANISGRQLAADLNLPYHMISSRLRLKDAVSFRAEELARIAKHLDVPIERLYGPPAKATA